MVSQCFNPECRAPFLYLREGRLIALRRRAKPAIAERVEFFWLCGECSNRMTVKMKLQGAMNLIARAEDSRMAPAGEEAQPAINKDERFRNLLEAVPEAILEVNADARSFKPMPVEDLKTLT